MDKDEYFKKLSQAGDPEPTPTAATPSEAKPDDGLKSIHTFKSDIADAIKKDSLSYASIASAEVERQKRIDDSSAAPESKTRSFFGIALSLVLLVVGLGIVVGAILFFSKSSAPTPTGTNQSQTGLTSNFQSTIHLAELDKLTLATSLNTERKKAFTKGQLKFVTLIAPNSTSSEPLDVSALINIIAPNLEGSTARSFQDDYKLGFYSGTNGNSTFLIFHTDSYDDAYGGMLDWEKYMNQDLTGFMIIPQTEMSTTTVGSVVISSSTASTTATSTASTTPQVISTVKNIPINFQFQDEVVDNKDARVLKDTEGNTIFLYSFLDQQTLVLATSEEALTEIENEIISAERVQ